MKYGKVLGITAGTLVASAGFWIGQFVIQDNLVTGLLFVVLGVVFGMYALAMFGGAEDIANVAFRSSLAAVVTGTALLLFFMVTETVSYVVIAPTLSIAIGGAIGVPPTGNVSRTLIRIAVGAVFSLLVVAVHWVDYSIYAFVAPLVALPAVALADRFFDMAVNVLAEPTT